MHAACLCNRTGFIKQEAASGPESSGPDAHLSGSGEHETLRLWNGEVLRRLGKTPGLYIAGEDRDVIRLLVGDQQPLLCWIEGQVTRDIAAAGAAGDEGKLAVLRIDGVAHEEVVVAVGGISEVSGVVENDIRAARRAGVALGKHLVPLN